MSNQQAPEQEANDVINQLYNDLQNEKTKNVQLNHALATSSFQGVSNNPIEYQLDNQELLAKCEHFLRGDYLSIVDGEEVWKRQKNKDKIIFNEYGTSVILSKLSSYLDKITSLSYYDEERIYEILADFGEELRKFIYINEKKVGLDNDYKKSNYTITVVNLLHAVESNYRRALHGHTATTINATNIYTMNQAGLMNQGQAPRPVKKFNLFRPSTW